MKPLESLTDQTFVHDYSTRWDLKCECTDCKAKPKPTHTNRDELLESGGLMRCCTETWTDTMLGTETPAKDGDTLQCRYHLDDPSHRMVRDGGKWKWDREEHFKSLNGSSSA